MWYIIYDMAYDTICSDIWYDILWYKLSHGVAWYRCVCDFELQLFAMYLSFRSIKLNIQI